MLQYLHEKVQGWLAWAVVGIIASTFVLFGASYYVGSRANNEVKATVNGTDVSRYAFDTTYRRLKQQSGSLNATAVAILKKQALEQLVLENIMLSAAKKNGFYIAKSQAETAILSTPDFQEDGTFSSQRFQQLLSQNQFTQNDYLKILSSGMMNNQVRFSFIATSFILQNELLAYVRYANQKRDYDYLVVKPSNIKLRKMPSELDYKKYYDDHSSLFMTAEEVSLDYVLLSMKDEMSAAKLEEGEVKNYYDENQSNFMTPARFKIKRIFIKTDNASGKSLSGNLITKIEQVQQSLKKESFEKVSAKYSDDLFSEKDSVAWVTLPSMNKHVASAVINLSVGAISDPIYTEKGMEIVKLIAKVDAKLTPFENVRSNLEKTLLTDKAQRNFQQKAEQLADLAYQNPDDLGPVAQALSLKVLQAGLSSHQAGFKAPMDNSSVIDAAFSEDVLKEHNNSQPIQLNDDALVVIRVNKHVASQLKPFDMVKAQIKSTVMANMKEKQAKLLAVSIKSSDQQAQNQLIKKNDLSWQKVANALRTYSEKADEQINQAAFDVSRAHIDAIVLSKLNNGGFALLKLTKVQDGELKDISFEQRELLNEQLSSNYGIKSYELYLQTLKKQAEVKVLN